MLPSHSAETPRLADVLASSLDSLSGAPNALDLPGVESAIVVVIDGLGLHNLQARRGHARTLASAMQSKHVARTTFPATTAAALTSLTTGAQPGEHGVVGYAVVHPETGLVMNQLTDWGSAMPPTSWQRSPTLFELAADSGLRMNAIGHSKFSNSGFSQAILRGTSYHAADSIAARFQLAAEVAQAPGVSYLYVSELDNMAHKHGWDSNDWLAALETVDAAVAAMLRELDSSVGVLVTADHGVIDVAPYRQLELNRVFPDGFADVVAVAGDPRVFTLTLRSGATEIDRSAVAAGWSEALGDTAWVFTRDQAVSEGLFGAVADEVLARIPDVFIAARKQVAFYDTRASTPRSMAMIGQHGSFSDEEVRVPVLRLGGYR